MSVWASALTAAALLFPAAPLTDPPDGAAVVRAMRSRYDGQWYSSLTFVQTTILTQPAPRTEIWHEALQFPGLLRIDIAPLDSGNTILFRNDSLYRFRQGKVAGSRPFVHPLMVLGFDVYFDAPEKTVARLTGLGFDLSQVHETTWQGKPVYVVGALAGDSMTKQFWIEKERLLFVRMLEPAPDGSGKVVETQFNRYQPLGKGWIAVEVLFNVGGQTVTREEYAEVRGGVSLPTVLFDPARYGAPEWVRR